jgi:hypothetical protein
VTWWAWAVVWVVLVLAGALVLFVSARRLYRQGMALVRELGTAAALFAEVSQTVEAGAALRAEGAAGGGDGGRARGGALASPALDPGTAGSRTPGRPRVS